MVEFARVLPAAMRDWTVAGAPGDWQVDSATGPVARVRVEALPERRVGALSLPVAAVTIRFADGADDRVDEFMRRFDRGFHRGGG